MFRTAGVCSAVEDSGWDHLLALQGPLYRFLSFEEEFAEGLVFLGIY